MKSGRKKLIGIVCACSVALVCGLGGYGSPVDAQTAESRTALLTARKATDHDPVIDSLSIETGGRKLICSA
jgi:hypothetical protein